MAMYDSNSSFKRNYLGDFSDNLYDDFKVSSIDLTIGGKGICVSLEAADEDVDTNFIKRKLADVLAQEIIEKGLCDFTKQKNPSNYRVTYRARCYLLPDDNLRALRINGAFN